MKWELERHGWGDFSKEAAALPDWIAELVFTQDANRAHELIYLIEAASVPVDGPLKDAAVAVAGCLVQGLLSATPVSKMEILYLLFQLAGAAADVSDSGLVRDLRYEIELGLPIYINIAETGTPKERLQCIDVLSLCARFGELSRSRAVFMLHQIANTGAGEASSVATELEDLTKSGYLV